MSHSVNEVAAPAFDVESLRQQFPILNQNVNGVPLVYLDNAATTQKPNCVIDALSNYYREYNSNVHRGAHYLSDKATQVFENARSQVAEFIGSASASQVLWTKGTTESINLVASSWGRQNVSSGDVILVPVSEHHSNIVPWQILAQEKNATVKPIPVNETGDIDLIAFERALSDRVRMVAVNHISNALGTINPIKKIVTMAHNVGAKVLVDGAQAVAHLPLDVEALGCDFYAFSGHKMFAPTGIGVLWGKKDLLESIPPYQGGGEMIETVSFDGTSFNELPYKFEAGTPNIADAIGMGAAVSFIQSLDRAAAFEHEASLLQYCIDKGEHFGLKRIGAPEEAACVYSFLLPGAHPADVGMLLDQQGVAVRTGHHCTQPLMSHLNIPGTVRASFSIYNTHKEIDVFFAALKKVSGFLI